jgi:DNA-binding response OmpR family regulator
MVKRRLTGRPKRPILKFVRGPRLFRGQTRLLLFINGQHVSAPATNTKLLAYLHAHLGKAISFHRLCLILGHSNKTEAERHILRQYVTWIRQLLDEHRAPYRLGTVFDFGYALCEIAPDASKVRENRWISARSKPGTR